jgi:Zn-dependent peptidase ImmA (M78 family)
MPEIAVRTIAAQYSHPEQDKTITLSHRFNVSIQSMRIRLKELDLQYREKAR